MVRHILRWNYDLIGFKITRKEALHMIYERIVAEKEKIEAEICVLREQILEYPEGKLFCTRNGKHYKWYRSDGKNHRYLPKKERALAECLAAKKYLSLRLEELQHEKCALDFYLRHHTMDFERSKRFITEESAYKELLASHFKPKAQELEEWVNEPFEQNSRYPEMKIHKTASGNMVRSKTEAWIDMMLYMNKIPFRYECGLQLDNIWIYPDFTIRHPETGEVYYWEHFGCMDDPVYSRNAISKLQLYISHNIIPTIHLITTYETREHPLSMEVIEKIVQHYFL